MESALLGERLTVKKREATRLDDLVSSVANAGAGWDVRISATLRLGREFDQSGRPVAGCSCTFCRRNFPSNLMYLDSAAPPVSISGVACNSVTT